MKSRHLYKIFIVTAAVIAAVTFLSCCGKSSAVPVSLTEAAESPEASPVPSPTPDPSPAPTPTPVPIIAEKGVYYERFTNEETSQYVDYCLMIPDNCTENMPLIMFLHGDGLTNRIDWLPTWGIGKRTTEIYGDNFPFILLMPCNRYPEWYDGGMGDTLKGLLDSISDEYCVNKDKIIITGHSRGSIATWQMANEYGNYFSCAVPCSCGAAHIHGENFIDVPVSAFCGGGENDYTCYYRDMKTIVDDINNKGGAATMTILWEYDHPDMDYAPYTEDTFNWMLSQ